MPFGELPTGTLTMLFTDIEGSTRLLRDIGSDAYSEILRAHRRVLRSAFAAHGGQEIGTDGDSFFVVFRRAREAVAAAAQAQSELNAHPWPGGVALKVRMGMHTGEPALTDEGYHGLSVNRAVRISALGHGSQILLSAATRAVVADELDKTLRLRDLGEHRMKDFDEPERIFEVRYPGAPDDLPPLKSLAAQPDRPPFARLFARARPRRSIIAGLAAAAVLTAGIVAFVGPAGDTPGTVEPDTVAVLTDDGSRLDAAIPVGSAPGGIAVGEGDIWVTNTEDDTVTRIGEDERVVVQRIPVGHGPAGIAVGGGFVWVANSLDGTVSRIDPRVQGGKEQQIIRVGNQPTEVAFGHGAVWVANAADKTLSRIDPTTGRARNGVNVGSGADALAVGPSGVWVASRSTNTVTQVDPRSLRRLQEVDVGQGPSGLAVTSEAVWVANEFDGTLSRVDPARGTEADKIPIGGSPRSIAVWGDRIWVTDVGGRMAEVDATSSRVASSIRLGARLGDLAASGGALYAVVQDSGAHHRGGTLELVGEDVVDHLDPALAYSLATWRVLSVTGDGLLGFRRVGGFAGVDLVPDLAQSLPTVSDGGRTLSFRLRRGLLYSTGDAVRASDFRRGIERNFDVEESPGASFFGAIVGAKACLDEPAPCDLSDGLVSDDRAGTLTIHLSRRDPDLPYKLTLPQAFPVPPGTPRSEAKGGVPGTGPYRIQTAEPHEEVLLVRNPRFREWSSAAQPEGYPDRIRLRLGLSADEQIAAIRGGSADLTTDTFLAGEAFWRRLTVTSASQVRISPVSGAAYVFLDTRAPPFADARVRRAVNLAVDRSVFDDSVTVRPTCQVLPPNSIGYRPYCPWGERPDLARARRLVARSGTRGMQVRLWGPVRGPMAKMVRVVADALRGLGYRVSRRAFRDDRAYFTKLNAGSRVQAGPWPWLADFPAPSTFVDLLRCGSTHNLTGFCDRNIDALARRAGALQSSDPQAANRVWADIDRRLTDASPFVPLTTLNALYFTSERLRNYQHHLHWGPLISQLWVK